MSKNFKRNEKQNKSRNNSRKQPTKNSNQARVNFDITGKVGQYAIDAGAHSYFEPIGLPEDFPFSIVDLGNSLKLTVQPSEYRTPGVMVLPFISGPGVSVSSDDAINIAAQKLYTWVRHVNAGHTNYERQDLVITILAVQEAYSYYYWLLRLYGVINYYSRFNRYLPETLIAAMGVLPSEVLGSKSIELRSYINYYAAKLSTLSIPGNIPSILRSQDLLTGIFADDVTAKSQLYLFNPLGFRIYDESATPSKLKFKPLHTNGTSAMTLSEIQDYGNALLQALLSSEDIGVICGDILKAYSDSDLLHTMQINPEFFVEPQVGNAAILAQIHNGFYPLVPQFAELTGGSWDITQSVAKQILQYQPSFAFNPMGIDLESHVIDAITDAPSSEDTITYTRFQPILHHAEEGGTHSYVVDACGTEIVFAPVIYQKPYSEEADATHSYLIKHQIPTLNIIDRANYIRGIYETDPAGIVHSVLSAHLHAAGPSIFDGPSYAAWLAAGVHNSVNERIPALSAFNFSPILYMFELGGVVSEAESLGDDLYLDYFKVPRATFADQETYGALIAFNGFVGDVRNLSIIYNNELQKIHNATLLAAFNIPVTGSWTA